MGSLEKATSNQDIRGCCIDRLSRQRLPDKWNKTLIPISRIEIAVRRKAIQLQILHLRPKERDLGHWLQLDTTSEGS